MSYDVFVGGADEDLVLAELIKCVLLSRDVSCWSKQPISVSGGGQQFEALSVLDTAKVFVLVYSDETLTSSIAASELAIAAARGAKIIVFKKSRAKPSGIIGRSLAGAYWFDATSDEPIYTFMNEFCALVEDALHGKLGLYSTSGHVLDVDDLYDKAIDDDAAPSPADNRGSVAAQIAAMRGFLELDGASSGSGDDDGVIINPLVSGGAPATMKLPTAKNAARHEVVLESFGEYKIKVIKVVRELTGLGLKEAKDLVESTPSIVMTCDSFLRAEDARQRLAGAGATVTVRRVGEHVPEPKPAEAKPFRSGLFSIFESSRSKASADMYNVVLESFGNNKIKVIKVVRELTGLGLKEAKDLVERRQAMVLGNVSQSEADAARRALEGAGATVTINRVS